jgi:hypothetical protein
MSTFLQLSRRRLLEISSSDGAASSVKRAHGSADSDQPRRAPGAGISSQNFRISARGSFSTLTSLSKTMVARFSLSWADHCGTFGSLGFAFFASATQAEAASPQLMPQEFCRSAQANAMATTVVDGLVVYQRGGP